jgi:hypothetical protein
MMSIEIAKAAWAYIKAYLAERTMFEARGAHGDVDDATLQEIDAAVVGSIAAAMREAADLPGQPCRSPPLSRLALVDNATLLVAKAEAGRMRARSTSFVDTEKVIPPNCELVVRMAEGRCLITVREAT